MTNENKTPFAVPFATAYPAPWRIQNVEVVDRDGCNVQDFDNDPDEREFWRGVVAAVNSAARVTSTKALEWRHLARQFDLMAKGCKSMGLHSVEDDFDRLRQSAMKGEVTADELVELIDYDYRTGQDGRGAAQLIFQALIADLSALPATSQAKATPAAKWREEGREDPHGSRYDCERAKLTMGDLTDDEMANAVFMADRSSLDLIAYQTAAKDRIRWLSRALDAALRPSSPVGQETGEA